MGLLDLGAVHLLYGKARSNRSAIRAGDRDDDEADLSFLRLSEAASGHVDGKQHGDHGHGKSEFLHFLTLLFDVLEKSDRKGTCLSQG